MSQLQQLIKQIDKLNPAEREQLLKIIFFQIPLTHASWYEWYFDSKVPENPLIVSTPTICGGAARLVRTRIPVWVIERMRQLGFSDVEILRSYPTLRAQDLVAARLYAARHNEEIEKDIRENEEVNEEVG